MSDVHHKPGYHLTSIPRGTYGNADKVLEEALEFKDACDQGATVMALVEASDILLAIKGWLEKTHPSVTMEDLAKMASITERAFNNGHRTPRNTS